MIQPKADRFLDIRESTERLMWEFNHYGGLTIAYDFDGTVHDYHKVGDTYPKVIELLRDLKEIGCKVVCWTSYPDLKYVADYLKENDIPCDGVNCGAIPLGWDSLKPFYSAILDDRCGLLQVYNELTSLVSYVRTMNKLKKDEDQSNT